MLLAYDSLTGNVQRFMEKLDEVKKVRITETLLVKEPFIVVTYTIGFGEVPELVEDFLEDNHEYLKGVVASGNRNWGKRFARAADIISNKYNVPIIHKFELSGTKTDVNKVLQGVRDICQKSQNG